jgi:hypothetical protein
MRKKYHRWHRLACALFVALAAAGASEAQDNAVIPIRDRPDLLEYYRWTYLADSIHRPLSYLDSPHPFKAIALDVQWAPNAYVSSNELREFAIHATRSRLQELGVADQIIVFEEPEFEFHGGRPPPQGLSYCDIFHVAFQLTAAPPLTVGTDEVAVAMTMLAYQPAENEAEAPEQSCIRLESRPSWVLHNGSRLFIVNPNQREALLAQVREQVLSLIDRVLICDAIIRSNETAHGSFNKIVFGRK